MDFAGRFHHGFHVVSVGPPPFSLACGLRMPRCWQNGHLRLTIQGETIGRHFPSCEVLCTLAGGWGNIPRCTNCIQLCWNGCCIKAGFYVVTMIMCSAGPMISIVDHQGWYQVSWGQSIFWIGGIAWQLIHHDVRWNPLAQVTTSHQKTRGHDGRVKILRQPLITRKDRESIWSIPTPAISANHQTLTTYWRNIPKSQSTMTGLHHHIYDIGILHKFQTNLFGLATCQVAERTLEQYSTAVLEHTLSPPPLPKPEFRAAMQAHLVPEKVAPPHRHPPWYVSPSSPSLVPIVQELSDISAAHYQETVFKSEDRKTTKLFFCAGGGCGFCGMVDGVPMRLGLYLLFICLCICIYFFFYLLPLHICITIILIAMDVLIIIVLTLFLGKSRNFEFLRLHTDRKKQYLGHTCFPKPLEWWMGPTWHFSFRTNTQTLWQINKRPQGEIFVRFFHTFTPTAELGQMKLHCKLSLMMMKILSGHESVGVMESCERVIWFSHPIAHKGMSPEFAKWAHQQFCSLISWTLTQIGKSHLCLEVIVAYLSKNTSTCFAW